MQALSDSFRNLITKLLDESYAKHSGLEAKTLLEASEWIEAQASIFDEPSQLTPEFISQVESFQQCRQIVILLLMDLDLLGVHEFPPETLGSLQAPTLNPIPAELGDYPPSTEFSENDAMGEKTMINYGISWKLSKPKSQSEEPLQELQDSVVNAEPETPNKDFEKSISFSSPMSPTPPEVESQLAPIEAPLSSDASDIPMTPQSPTLDSNWETLPEATESHPWDGPPMQSTVQEVPAPIAPEPVAEPVKEAKLSPPPLPEFSSPSVSIEDEDAMSEKTMITMGITLQQKSEPKESVFEEVPKMKMEAPVEPPTLSEAVWAPQEDKPLAPVPSESPFLEVAHFLDSLKSEGKFPMEKVFIDRLIAQQFCLAIEDRCLALLLPQLEERWTKRDQAVKHLLNPDSERFELNPELRSALETLSEAHPEWLPDGGISFGAITTALRYIVSTPSADRFQPSPLEAAVILLLLGQSGRMGSYPLKNALEMHGLNQNELLELTFRMFRVQKIKAKCIAVTLDFDPTHLTTITDDANRILSLLKKITFDHLSQKVA